MKNLIDIIEGGGTAYFDDKDIMTDAFLEILATDGEFIQMQNGTKAVCFVSEGNKNIPVYVDISKRSAVLRTVSPTMFTILGRLVEEKLDEWNKQTKDDPDNGYIWTAKINKEDSEIVVTAAHPE